KEHQIGPALLDARQFAAQDLFDGYTRCKLAEQTGLIPLEEILHHQVILIAFLHDTISHSRRAHLYPPRRGKTELPGTGSQPSAGGDRGPQSIDRVKRPSRDSRVIEYTRE